MGLSTMYSTVIKMNAENVRVVWACAGGGHPRARNRRLSPPHPHPQRINLRNTWSLPLIDHMESLILGEGGGGVRGQFMTI